MSSLDRWSTLSTNWGGGIPRKQKAYLLHKTETGGKCGWCVESTGGPWYCTNCGEHAPKEMEDLMLLVDGMSFPVHIERLNKGWPA